MSNIELAMKAIVKARHHVQLELHTMPTDVPHIEERDKLEQCLLALELALRIPEKTK